MKIKPLKALEYLDDMAHGRKMDYNPHELKCVIEKALKRLEFLEMADRSFTFFFGGREAGKTAFTMSICNRLNALETIILKKVSFTELDFVDWKLEDYNRFQKPHEKLSQKEFKIIKDLYDERIVKAQAL